MQVLIVEDEVGIRENLRDLLEDAGDRVAGASDGAASPPGVPVLAKPINDTHLEMITR